MLVPQESRLEVAEHAATLGEGLPLGYLPDGDDPGPLEELRRHAARLLQAALQSPGGRYRIGVPDGRRAMSDEPKPTHLDEDGLTGAPLLAGEAPEHPPGRRVEGASGGSFRTPPLASTPRAPLRGPRELPTPRLPLRRA